MPSLMHNEALNDKVVSNTVLTCRGLLNGSKRKGIKIDKIKIVHIYKILQSSTELRHINKQEHTG